ncbi:ras-related protein rab-37 [Anaeramoeba ignava]|uniref:Ras-related protein rab-37 n=1 Tax=Anaeramoeba ignava TaxID=1746090 RepID=A0A9Q0LKM8_ANAIG|nr:ras-related protein rab-37 [Anaeramoeba ignava]
MNEFDKNNSSNFEENSNQIDYEIIEQNKSFSENQENDVSDSVLSDTNYALPNTNQETGEIFKIVLVGKSGVGKTNLLSRFCRNEFRVQTKPTIGDTAGQERFRSITPIYYRGAQAAMVVYDITKLSTFEEVKRCLEELNRYAGEDIVISLIGNKCDLEKSRKISKEKGETFARNNNLLFMETSAKEGTNVDLIFIETLKKIKAKFAPPSIPEKSISPLSQNDKKEKKKKCC